MAGEKKLQNLCRVCHCSSLQEITDLAIDVFGNPMFIEDMSNTTLAFTQAVTINDPSWQSRVVNDQLACVTMQQRQQSGRVNAASMEHRMPILVEDDNVPVPRIVKALISGGRHVGTAVLSAHLRPFRSGDLELMELVCSYIIPIMVQGQYHLSSDNKSLENFFIKLLDGGQLTEDQVLRRFTLSGYTPQDATYIMALTARTADTTPQDSANIIAALSQLPYCRAFYYGTAIVCVYGDEGDNLGRAPSRMVDVLTGFNLVAGISRRITQFSRLRDCYRQAVCALELGHLLRREAPLYFYDNLSMYQMLQSIPDGLLGQYCHQKIYELAEYDRKHNTDFCETLQVYLENTKSLAKTAELLFIHRNTVHYRVSKCMELLGSSLESGGEIFTFLLSLHIVEYQRKLLRQ